MSDRLMFALAGLLHDIGKFGQRADVSWGNSEELSEQSKRIADSICRKTKDGYYTHLHVIWTNNFLEAHRDIFIQANLYGEGDNNLFNLASYHHRPSTLEQAIITMADHWSSGIDRNSESSIDKAYKFGKYKYKTVPLVSVFNELKTNTKPNGLGTANFGYPIQAMSIDKNIFPLKISELTNIQEQYQKLWKEFNDEFSKLKGSNPENLVYSIYHLLKKYTWYIPASTMDYPNCSLFEHMKITGAFADALYAFHESTKSKSGFTYSPGGRLEISDGSSYPVLMFCGDISGIQSFIYNISNKSAMKGLKGRSFFVQLLADALCDDLIERTGSSIINLVYSAGGKFYLLLPNTNEVLQSIDEFIEETQKDLWDEHKGKLTLSAGYVKFRMISTNNGLKVNVENLSDHIEVGELWKLLAEETSRNKRRKYDVIINDNFDEMFEAHGYGGNVQTCSVSGDEIFGSEIEDLSDDDDNPIIVSQSVKKQIDLGSSLYDAISLIQYKDFRNEGVFIGTSKPWQIVKETDHIHTPNKWINMRFDGNVNIYPKRTLDKDTGFGFRFYGGVEIAKKNNRIATLEELCEMVSNNNISSTDKLGVLRMDVDDLGTLFMSGFSTVTSSFSMLATLSSSLDQFFSGYLNTIKAEFRDTVNIVYSGGDDLFAVGKWDDLLKFGINVRTAFQEFVCGRSDISISGGIAIVGAKFPIAKAAEMSGEAEKAAKNHVTDGQLKNALNLFGISVNWESEMPFVLECKEDLVKWVSSKTISKGLLMKMFDYYQTYLQNKEDWKWQSAYTISRFKQEKSRQLNDILDTLTTLLYTGNYKNKFRNIRFEAFIVACRWAELELKNNLN